MANRKMFYMDKSGSLVWEMPGLGEIKIKDHRNKNDGQIEAVMEIEGKKVKIGYLDYELHKTPEEQQQQLRVSRLFVHPDFQGLRLGTILVGVAQAHSPGKTVIQDIIHERTLKIAKTLDHEKIGTQNSDTGQLNFQKS